MLQEPFRLAYLDDFPMLHDGYLLCAGYSVVPVGYHQRRAIVHQAFQRLPDEHFAFRIETRSWLIQDEQRGIFKKRASNSDTLRLTSAQTRPALTNLSFVAAWQLIDELCRAREFGRIPMVLPAPRSLGALADGRAIRIFAITLP